LTANQSTWRRHTAVAGDETSSDGRIRKRAAVEQYRRIAHHGRVFSSLVDLAARRATAGRHRSALEWCRVAAGFAVTNPTGELRSARLEDVVDDIAGSLPVLDTPASGTDKRRVLHVLSESASVGGLTRLAARWIAHDTASVSTVVLSRQADVAQPLVDAVTESGGSIFSLGHEADPIERARAIRRYGHDADVVVCHLQPDDPIPAVAFGRGYAGAPVAYFNHADHIFWIAPSRASLLVDFRQAGRMMSSIGRGYSERSLASLPLLVPEPPVEAAFMRTRIRDDLGISDDQVMVVSVARAVKFQSTDLRPRFAEMLMEILEANPTVVFCAVGPEATDEPWPELLRRFPDRIRVTGPSTDPQQFLGAADVYLDTFPFSSLTSLLEAAATPLPTLTLDGHDGLRRTLGITDFVAPEADRPLDLAGVVERIRVLVSDKDARALSAAEARALVQEYSSVSRWTSQLEALYDLLLTDAARPILGAGAPRRPSPEQLDYALAVLAIEDRVPLQWRIVASLPYLDARDRRMWTVRSWMSRVFHQIGLDEVAERVLLPVPWKKKPTENVSEGKQP
jgi:hypothetical protein